MRWILLAICFLPSISPADIAQTKFAEAIAAYSAGDYPKAISNWDALVAEGIQSHGLHFNLGNAYYRTGELGKAIFHFRKAASLSPRDPDALFNLKYARSRRVDRLDQGSSLGVPSWLAVLSPLSPNEALWFSLSLWLLLWIYLAGVSLRRVPIWGGFVMMGLWLVSATMLTGAFGRLRPFGTVLDSNVNAMSATGKDSVALFTLHEGAEFQVVSVLDDQWVQIELPDGKKGWLPRSSVLADL